MGAQFVAFVIGVGTGLLGAGLLYYMLFKEDK